MRGAGIAQPVGPDRREELPLEDPGHPAKDVFRLDPDIVEAAVVLGDVAGCVLRVLGHDHGDLEIPVGALADVEAGEGVDDFRWRVDAA